MTTPTDDSARELKPCPFCASTKYLGVYPYDVEVKGFRVHCACGADGPVYGEAQNAIAAWNTRANPPAPEQERVEGLREAIDHIVLLNRSLENEEESVHEGSGSDWGVILEAAKIQLKRQGQK